MITRAGDEDVNALHHFLQPGDAETIHTEKKIHFSKRQKFTKYKHYHFMLLVKENFSTCPKAVYHLFIEVGYCKSINILQIDVFNNLYF